MCTSRDDSESREPNWLHLYSWDLSTNMNRIVPYKGTGLNPSLHTCDMEKKKAILVLWLVHDLHLPHTAKQAPIFSTVLLDSLCSFSWMTLGRITCEIPSGMSEAGDRTAQTFSCYGATTLAVLSFKYSSTCFWQTNKKTDTVNYAVPVVRKEPKLILA